MKSFKCVLLIDDDKSINRFHQIVMQSLGLVNVVVEKRNGKKALAYLSNTVLEDKNCSTNLHPEIIFVDLNMPVMDGFKFIDTYTKTEEYIIHKPIIIVLSTSLIPQEKEKIESNDNILMFVNKPLTKDGILKIFELCIKVT